MENEFCKNKISLDPDFLESFSQNDLNDLKQSFLIR